MGHKRSELKVSGQFGSSEDALSVIQQIDPASTVSRSAIVPRLCLSSGFQGGTATYVNSSVSLDTRITAASNGIRTWHRSLMRIYMRSVHEYLVTYA